MTVYLDYAATTPLRTEVFDCYVTYLKELGNPSSVHISGQNVRRALEEARESLAKSVDCDRNEVIFTAGGTESDNLAIKGIFWQRKSEDQNRNIIISAGTEHHAVIDPIEWLEKHEGAQVLWLPVDSEGVIDLDNLATFLFANHQSVNLISLMWANNETGVITDIHRVVDIAKQYGIPVHSDAIAAFGHTPLSFKNSGLSAMSISAHKIGGPVGAGALIVARDTKLVSLVHGGGQERGMRSGTMNAPVAKAFALSAEITIAELESEMKRIGQLRDHLVSGVLAVAKVAQLTGSKASRLPNNAHFTFSGCSGDSLLFLLDQQGICVSTGSACQAGVNGPSHVLVAMGRTDRDANGCLRMTLGKETTQEEIDMFLKALPSALDGALRAGLPS
ncbi:MAG: cysteine desulfurase [Micrococcales bacterium]|nr:cysteine desulfurase [Actinomycetota bacterium]NCA07506.1 cysteine desulfurase [Micrococcales bacterium]